MFLVIIRFACSGVMTFNINKKNVFFSFVTLSGHPILIIFRFGWSCLFWFFNILIAAFWFFISILVIFTLYIKNVNIYFIIFAVFDRVLIYFRFFLSSFLDFLSIIWIYKFLLGRLFVVIIFFNIRFMSAFWIIFMRFLFGVFL